MKLTIREELTTDYTRVENTTQEAFKTAKHTDHTEHLLVKRLRTGTSFIKELSLVAEIDNEIIGSLLLTKAKIINETAEYETLALAPVSIIPQFQDKGIGSTLISIALEKATNLGFSSVIILGHPEYYPRFGFVPCSKFGIKAPFEVPDEAFMAKELQPNSLKNITGTVTYAKEFLL